MTQGRLSHSMEDVFYVYLDVELVFALSFFYSSLFTSVASVTSSSVSTNALSMRRYPTINRQHGGIIKDSTSMGRTAEEHGRAMSVLLCTRITVEIGSL